MQITAAVAAAGEAAAARAAREAKEAGAIRSCKISGAKTSDSSAAAVVSAIRAERERGGESYMEKWCVSLQRGIASERRSGALAAAAATAAGEAGAG